MCNKDGTVTAMAITPLDHPTYSIWFPVADWTTWRSCTIVYSIAPQLGKVFFKCATLTNIDYLQPLGWNMKWIRSYPCSEGYWERRVADRPILLPVQLFVITSPLTRMCYILPFCDLLSRLQKSSACLSNRSTRYDDDCRSRSYCFVEQQVDAVQ